MAIHLYQMSLDVLLASRPPDTVPLAVAVLDHDVVVMPNQPARAMGVRPGMARNSALAIAPDVALVDRDAPREREALDAMALALLQYTPEVAQAEENVILLNVGASLTMFGGPRALCRRVRSTVAVHRMAARVGMAPTAGGAWLLARSTRRRRRVLGLPSLTRVLDALPCLLMPAARPYRDWLQSIGCRTLGGLARLPRAGLRRRTGADLLQALDRAYGREAELFRWVQPPPEFHRRLELLERLEHAEAALFGASRLVEQMCGWLVTRRLAAARVVLVLEHERGRQAMPPTLLEIRLAEPAWQPEHVLRLLKEHLGRLVLPAPVAAIGLSATHLETPESPNETLFEDPARSSADRRRLLELLTARLGRERVLHPAPVCDHRPEVANCWVSVDEAGENHQAFDELAKPGHHEGRSSRPFWLLAQPMPLTMSGERPVYGSVLRLVRGPERIEAGWWEGRLAARDYFVAEDAQAARYWIYRERDAGVAGWFLHGLFA